MELKEFVEMYMEQDKKWTDLFVASVVQVKYVWLYVSPVVLCMHWEIE